MAHRTGYQPRSDPNETIEQFGTTWRKTVEQLGGGRGVNNLMPKITFNGTDAEYDRVASFLRLVTATIGRYIDPVEIVTKPRAEMPEFSSGKHAFGFWDEIPNRRLKLAHEAFLIAPSKTYGGIESLIGHEFTHVLAGDWWQAGHWHSLLPYLKPTPSNRNDATINGVNYGYAALPSECLADDLGAALYGLSSPSFPKLYKRSIPKDAWATAARIAISCNG